MRHRAQASRIVAAMIAAVLSFASTATPQPAVDQLEAELRNAPPAVVTPALIEPGYLGIVVDDRLDVGRGIRVVDVTGGAPADQAGLRINDLVTAIDAQPVQVMDDFVRAMTASPPGVKRAFQVMRGPEELQLTVTLGKRPLAGAAGTEPAVPAPMNPDPTESESPPVAGGLLGVRVAAVTPEMQRTLSLPSLGGAIVVSVTVGSPADSAGLEPEAVIVAIDGRRVEDPNSLAEMISRAGGGAKVKIAFFLKGQLVERTMRLAGGAPPPAVVPPPSVPMAIVPPPVVNGPNTTNGEARMRALEERIRELERRLGEIERTLQGSKT